MFLYSIKIHLLNIKPFTPNSSNCKIQLWIFLRMHPPYLESSNSPNQIYFICSEPKQGILKIYSAVINLIVVITKHHMRQKAREAIKLFFDKSNFFILFKFFWSKTFIGLTFVPFVHEFVPFVPAFSANLFQIFALVLFVRS